MFWRRGFGGQFGSPLFAKTVFKFFVVTSFQFVAFVFFVAVGSDKIRKPLPFSLAAGLYFFQS